MVAGSIPWVMNAYTKHQADFKHHKGLKMLSVVTWAKEIRPLRDCPFSASSWPHWIGIYVIKLETHWILSWRKRNLGKQTGVPSLGFGKVLESRVLGRVWRWSHSLGPSRGWRLFLWSQTTPRSNPGYTTCWLVNLGCVHISDLLFICHLRINATGEGFSDCFYVHREAVRTTWCNSS